MSTSSEWLQLLEKRCTQCASVFLTQYEFELLIDEILCHPASPICGLEFELEFDAPFQKLKLGKASAGNSEARNVYLNDSRGGRARILWWRKKEGDSFSNLKHEPFEDLLMAWWKPDLRTASAGLPDLKREAQAASFAEATVKNCLQRKEMPSVLFFDLDNFGKVNKQFNQEKGDLVIKQFAALAESQGGRFGILLHDGGDEMLLLCPNGGASIAIRAAFAIAKAVKDCDFSIAPLTIGMSGGVSAADAPEPLSSFQKMKEEADTVLKTDVKPVKKGTTRFKRTSESSFFEEWNASDLASFLKSLVLCASDCEAPFGNAWLNALSSLVVDSTTGSDCDVPIIASIVSEFLEWMSYDTGVVHVVPGAPPKFTPNHVYTGCSVSPLSIAFAIVHGCLRSRIAQKLNPRVAIKYADDQSFVGIYTSDGILLWRHGKESDSAMSCAVPFSSLSTGEAQEPSSPPTKAVLIKIGHSALPLPHHLFSEIIVVDDRPARGGCLPDFWELTIARLVDHIHYNRNVCGVFVFGNKEHGHETVARLENLSLWSSDSENMASRLAVSQSMLREAGEFLNGLIFFPKDYPELIHSLCNQIEHAKKMQFPAQEPEMRPLLNRPLTLGSKALTEIDGCRVESIAEAFPIILEILRKAEGRTILDQAGQQLLELIDFKVLLTRPEIHKVPFYYRSQETRMAEYFQCAFLDENRFFGKAFRSNNQLELVMQHLVNVISESEFATRRAILVAPPPEAATSADWSPLGLVSVRLIPRFLGSNCELSYSFTWRTVEAMVGFPYSIYGSVRFAQELTRMIADRVGAKKRIALGEVSYLAHSLHMFKDDYSKAIVRRIVNDATI